MGASYLSLLGFYYQNSQDPEDYIIFLSTDDAGVNKNTLLEELADKSLKKLKNASDHIRCNELLVVELVEEQKNNKLSKELHDQKVSHDHQKRELKAPRFCFSYCFFLESARFLFFATAATVCL
jgi:hypothetical protein